MAVRFNTSAGEFFEFIRPASIILSGLLSTWILASARRRYPSYLAFLWAITTFFFPLIVIPIYWVVLLARRSRIPLEKIRWRFLLPLLYATLILGGSTIYLYRQNTNVDAHLFKASQAKVNGDTPKAIAEYRNALALEENAHTRKLLAMEYYKSTDLEDALREFQRAESGGEPDDSLHFLIGSIQEELNLYAEARTEYKLFLETASCQKVPVDVRCDVARIRLSKSEINSRKPGPSAP